MNKEQIIKAWECCDGTLAGCQECPEYSNRYRCTIKQKALALIEELIEANNRLNERLAEENKKHCCDVLRSKNEGLFNLSEDSFNKILREAKKLKPAICICGSAASIRIRYAFYGPVGARAECNRCGRTGPMQHITDAVGSGDKIATPVTDRSLVRGIKTAVKEWNLSLAKERKQNNENQ